MHTDYEYYKNSFAGTLIPAKEFPPFAEKVSRYLNYVCREPVKELLDTYLNEQIQNSVCAGAEALYELHQTYSAVPKGIKSENTDGYSVTYTDFDIEKFRKEESKVIYLALEQELSGTGLLYQGG